MTKPSTNIYQHVVEKWQRDAKIDPTEFEPACFKTPQLHGEYLNEYGKAASLFEKLKLELDSLKHEKNKHFNGLLTKEEIEKRGWSYDPFNGATKPLKSEMDKWISVDKEVQELSLKVEEARIYKEIVKYIMDDLKWRGNLLKLIQENRKMVNGF